MCCLLPLGRILPCMDLALKNNLTIYKVRQLSLFDAAADNVIKTTPLQTGPKILLRGKKRSSDLFLDS